jgi:hypothetical protein
MFCQLQGQGGAGESSETQTVRQEIAIVREELKVVTLKIDGVEVKITECKDPKEKEFYWKREGHLREEKARLQQKELILLQSGANSNLCISSRPPLFPSLFFFASSNLPSSITRFPCICLFFPLPNVVTCICLRVGARVFQRVRLFVRLASVSSLFM